MAPGPLPALRPAIRPVTVPSSIRTPRTTASFVPRGRSRPRAVMQTCKTNAPGQIARAFRRSAKDPPFRLFVDARSAVASEDEGRSLLEGCLELIGCNVLIAENALQALGHVGLEQDPLPDLVILGLPPQARRTLLERIRRDPRSERRRS